MSLFHDPKFWLAISFLIFVGLIIKYVFPFILRMIDGKANQIKTSLEEAKAAKEKAEKLLQDAEKYYEDSVKYGEQIIKDATQESQNIISEYKTNLEAEINKKVEAANNRIKNSEERVVREIKSKIIQSAIGAIAQNVKEVTDEKSFDEATKNSINQISSKLIN